MDRNSELYHCTCKDRTCPGVTVIECRPPIYSEEDARPVRPACPICGRKMNMVLMTRGEIKIIPEVSPHESMSNVLRSRIIYTPIRSADEDEAEQPRIPAEIPKADAPQRGQQQAPQEAKVLTDEDVAMLLKVPVERVKILKKQKRLMPIKFGRGEWGYTLDIIDDFLKREAGIATNKEPWPGDILATRPQGITLEKSRKLMRNMRKKNRDNG